MKYIYILLAIGAIIIAVAICSTPAKPHGGERVAIYNLSGMINIMSRQLDRIEDKLADYDCISSKDMLDDSQTANTDS